MMKTLKSAAIAATVLMLPLTSFAQNTYDVNSTSNPPTIDGIVSAGEWADAATAVGGWRVLRQANGPTDVLNNQFQLMWDSNYLYLLSTSDHGAWTTNQRDVYRGGANNINIYIDPDLDNEGNVGTETAPFSMPDGYQIAVNQYLGSYSCTTEPCSVDTTPDNLTNPINSGAVGSNLSTFAEAHIDGLFGNNGEWLGMRGTQIATVNGTSGGVIEIAIPWSDLDAPGLDTNGGDPGLNINGAAPVDGDQWLFNIAQIVNSPPAGNALPAWNWYEEPSGGNEFFAAQPHGVITFVAATTSVLKGDVNLDGSVTFLDIAPFITALSNGQFDPNADCDCDGDNDFLDIAPFIAILSSGP